MSLKFNTLGPIAWKSGLIMRLLHRAKKICSTTELYERELKRLRHIFCDNGL